MSDQTPERSPGSEAGHERDQPIADAYDRLATALAPPPDVAVRVHERLGARRRARRMGAVGAVGLVAAAVVGGAALLGSGDGGADVVATDDPAASGSFVLTRPDGSTYEITDLTVSCKGPFAELRGEDPRGPQGPQRIWLTSPMVLAADGETPEQPFLLFEGIVDKIAGQTFALPSNGSSDERAFTLFAVDTEVPPSAERPNEVSSAEEDAVGSVVVTRASCDPVPVLEIEVDATLGSEVSLGTVAVAGSFG